MSLDRGYRKAERMASVRVWQGAVVAIAALVLNGLLATISKGAGDLMRPVVEVLGWVVPIGLFALAFALVISGTWMIWRLRADFRSAHGG
ncbi:hypothetical protein HIV01_014785 [Lysobacter arenosi]|uniref:Uncharacterized protein n=1 Tax=Lysobacter arenosi TaxID=2795387 RepID=A0ABX7RAW3_9GAMM|nr:hypothetical protein [Lysobacter arenosi]QSX74436.1 hypothetical protein HIV01_014785 [Lysobacter arenosi]